MPYRHVDNDDEKAEFERVTGRDLTPARIETRISVPPSALTRLLNVERKLPAPEVRADRSCSTSPILRE
jgi:hypothetical protein